MFDVFKKVFFKYCMTINNINHHYDYDFENKPNIDICFWYYDKNKVVNVLISNPSVIAYVPINNFI